MHSDDVQRVLITRQQIAGRVAQLASQVAADPAFAAHDRAAEITLIPLMTGAMIFAADLIRQLPMRMRIGLLTVSSYPGATTRSKGAKVLSASAVQVAGRRVLLVDDILDSGGTIRAVREMLEAQRPAALKVCVLLRKPTPGASRTPVDYVGFDIPDEFVVGYGLDYNDYYRNLPEIVTLKREILAASASGAEAT